MPRVVKEGGAVWGRDHDEIALVDMGDPGRLIAVELPGGEGGIADIANLKTEAAHNEIDDNIRFRRLDSRSELLDAISGDTGNLLARDGEAFLVFRAFEQDGSAILHDSEPQTLVGGDAPLHLLLAADISMSPGIDRDLNVGFWLSRTTDDRDRALQTVCEHEAIPLC